MGNRIYDKIVIITMAAMCGISCSDLGDCVKGTGEIVPEERPAGFFDAITLDDDINLMILNDTFQSIEVEAGKNLLPEIVTEVSDGMLYIRNDNVCKYSRSYQKEIMVKVGTSFLDKLAFAGSARITSGNILSFSHLLMWLDGARGEINLEINIEELIIEHVSGNGLTVLSGEVKDGIINSEAQGLLYLKDLKISNLKMISNSYNDAWIWVTDTIDITISNLGNVYCRGNPVVRSYHRTGEGRFILLN